MVPRGHGIYTGGNGGITLDHLNIQWGKCFSHFRPGFCQSDDDGLLQHPYQQRPHNHMRDGFNGSVVKGVQGNIYDNTITNGVHAGIVLAGGTASNVYGNTIQLKGKYTNGFAIVDYNGNGSQIYNNTINCGAGEYSSRGIFVGGAVGTGLTKVYNNVINVHGKIDNQEYEGVVLGGSYGLQLENAKGVEVYGNTITAYGDETEAVAFE